MILPVDSPELKLEMPMNTGLTCQGSRSENTVRRAMWRRDGDSNPKYGRQVFGHCSDYWCRNGWQSLTAWIEHIALGRVRLRLLTLIGWLLA